MPTVPSFEPGRRLTDGSDLQAIVNLTLASKPGLTALAGGGQTGATQLAYDVNEVSTSGAGGTDSVVLPPAVPGTTVTVINSTGNTIAIFASVATVGGVALTDTITPNSSITPTASGTATSLATAKVASFYCFKNGAWKMSLTA